jgi:peptidoglycan/LPS O-acetylase OafA/YrhL
MPQLDGLRAIAVAGVLFAHAGPSTFAHGINTGPLGVRLFFVLSGFLITGILLRARPDRASGDAGVTLRAFYARRFLRIFPLYYAVLFAVTLIGLPEARETFWWNLFYSSNYFYALHGEWRGAVSHFWSLAVEEQFYLVWPWLVLFTPLSRLPFLLGATVVAAPMSRLFLARASGSLITTSTPTIACLDSLGAGALLAWLWYASDTRSQADRDQRVKRLARIALVVGIVSYVVMDLCVRFNTGWTLRMALWDLTVSLVFAWLVNGAARGFRGPAGALLSSPVLVYLGTISYGIYVYHPFVDPAVRGLGNLFNVAVPFPEEGGALRLACVSLGAILMASISWHFYERPLNGLKSRFSYTSGTSRPRIFATANDARRHAPSDHPIGHRLRHHGAGADD